MELHNTAIKKNCAEILETRNEKEQISKISTFLQPSIMIEPSLTIFKSTSNYETSQLYVCPSDYQFFLTNVILNVAMTGAAGNINSDINFVLMDGTTETVTCWTATSESDMANSISIQFPKRGLPLKRGSVIGCSLTNHEPVYAAICGYLASDRGIP